MRHLLPQAALLSLEALAHFVFLLFKPLFFFGLGFLLSEQLVMGCAQLVFSSAQLVLTGSEFGFDAHDNGFQLRIDTKEL
eukprot:858539-Amorphochlora_amoeboformis.AAC.1